MGSDTCSPPTTTGMLYFAATKTEYTYESLRNNLAQGRLKKLYKIHGFDIAKYNELKVVPAAAITAWVHQLAQPFASPESNGSERRGTQNPRGLSLLFSFFSLFLEGRSVPCLIRNHAHRCPCSNSSLSPCIREEILH